MLRHFFRFFLATLIGSTAYAMAPVELCETALNPPEKTNNEIMQRHLRLIFNTHEIDVYIGGDSKHNSLENSYLVVGSNRKTEPLSSARKIEILPRYDFERIEFSPNLKTISFFGSSIHGVTLTLRLGVAYGPNEPLDVREVSVTGLKNGPKFLREGHSKPLAVLDDEVDVKIYNGAAAQEIYELLKANLKYVDKNPYYRGLHFFNGQGLYAPLYLQTDVEMKYLLRGLRALGLRADHPIFRSFN